MVPFIALIASFVFFRLLGWLGWLGWSYVDHWGNALSLAVAVMFFLTASAHWGKKRSDLIKMVPPVFPFLVFLLL